MPTFDADTVARLLQTSSLGQARAAARAVGVEVLQADAFDVDACCLAATYGVRLSALRARKCAHSQQLGASVAELCDNLRTFRGEACWLLIPGPRSTTYHVLITADATRILGCLVVVSKLDVTDAEWLRLWEDRRDDPA